MATADRIAGLWQRRVSVARRIIPAIMTDLEQFARVEGQRQLSKLIYSKPEDVSSTGRKKWVRTGRLRNAETVTLTRGPGADVFSLTLKNPVSYAEPRHEAGKPGRRKTNRPAHWQDETRKACQSRLKEYAAAIPVRVKQAI
jgi:hypothetical protein